MPTKKHTGHLHRYKKINKGVNGKEYFVYKCINNCNRYVPCMDTEGEECECNSCHQPMIMGAAQLFGSSGKPMTKPICIPCKQRKKGKIEDFDAIASFLEKK